MNLRRLFLYLTIASVAVSAVIGIGVMIFGNFGEFETKVLLTSMTVTITSILGLACGANIEAGRGRMIPYAGIALAIVSAVTWMVMIWAERTGGEVFAKSVMTATLLATACAHVSLLSLARLDRRFRWSHWAAPVVVWSLCALILICIWFDVDPSNSAIARTMGVQGILIGALTVITPVFHKLSSGERVEDIDAEIRKLREQLSELEGKRDQITSKSQQED